MKETPNPTKTTPPIPRPPIKLITIRGERHSGTGWLRTMIKNNCPDLLNYIPGYRDDADGIYGWKHSVFHDHGCLPTYQRPLMTDDSLLPLEKHSMNSNLQNLVEKNCQEEVLQPDHFLITLVRDFKDWIPKMKEETYERQPKNGLPMSEFLTSTWTPRNEMHWKDIFDMRTSKYQNWIEFSQNHPDQSLVIRYEDLLHNPVNFFKKLHVEFNITCRHTEEDFIYSHGYAKFNTFLANRPQPGKPRGQVTENQGHFQETKPYEYDAEDYQFILTKIDFNLEKKLGYL